MEVLFKNGLKRTKLLGETIHQEIYSVSGSSPMHQVDCPVSLYPCKDPLEEEDYYYCYCCCCYCIHGTEEEVENYTISKPQSEGLMEVGMSPVDTDAELRQ